MIKPENPIIKAYDNAVVSTNALVGLSFLVKSPEPYSLIRTDIESVLSEQIRAVNLFSEDVYYHKIDLYTEERVDGSDYFFSDDFLSKIDRDYFSNRETYKNISIITFFKSNIKTLEKEYLANPFVVKEKLIEKDNESLKVFKSLVNNAVSIINNTNHVELYPIEENVLRHFIFNQINGFNFDGCIKTSNYQEYNKIGDNYFKIFHFSSADSFSISHETIEDEKSLTRSKYLQRNIFDELGIHFHFNHVCNQIIKIPNQETTAEILEVRKATYKGWRQYNNSIQTQYDNLLDFEKAFGSEEDKYCYSHNNIMLFSKDKTDLEKASNKLKEILSQKGLNPLEADYEIAETIYRSSIIGRENELPDNVNNDKYNYFFLSSLKNSLPLSPFFGNYTDDNEGLVFQNRLTRAPRVVDVLDLNKKYIAARNAAFVTRTGEGKSSALLNICSQFIMQGLKLVCVEFGQSFSFLVRLFKDRAIQIRLKPNTPLGINPFNLYGKPLDTVKVISITGFLLKLMRKNIEMIQNDGVFFVSLQKIVKNYYSNNFSKHNIQSFYNYVVNNWEKIKLEENLKDEFFDIDKFELIISQFVKGGLYSYVFEDNSIFDKEINKYDLIVYELTEIKKDPFLLSIVITALEDTINSVILSDKSVLGGVIFEEFGETSELKDIFGGGDVLSSVAWLCQKIRKDNGFIWLILQNISQLPKNHYTENIISNLQLLFTLGMNEKVANDVIEAFKIKNPLHINMMKSCSKQFENFPKWSEMFIRWDENRATVVRNEFSIQKLLSFQTEGDLWDWMDKDYENNTKDIEITIENALKEFNYEKNNYPDIGFIDKQCV